MTRASEQRRRFRRLRQLLRDEGIMEMTVGAALAFALVGVIATAVSMVTGPFWDPWMAGRPLLTLGLVVLVSLALWPRPRRPDDA